MTRAFRSLAAAAVALVLLVVAPAVSDAGTRSSKITETIWHVTSASGTQKLSMSGADPDNQLDQFTADVTARWRTTTKHNSTLTFGWPVPKIKPFFPDPGSFASLIKPKVELIGSASGQVRVNNTPQPFSCQANTGKNPETYLPSDTVPITGGTLSGARLGIGAILRSNPLVLFDQCNGPGGLTVHEILGGEQLTVNKPTYKPIPVNHLRKGHKGEKMTLVIDVKYPILTSSGARVGTVDSKATLHLKFGLVA